MIIGSINRHAATIDRLRVHLFLIMIPPRIFEKAQARHGPRHMALLRKVALDESAYMPSVGDTSRGVQIKSFYAGYRDGTLNLQ
jgi:hypothetical protein